MFKRFAMGAMILASAGIQQMKAVTVFASQSGWYQSSTGANNNAAATNNYFAGLFPDPNGNTYNDYFVFDIPVIPGGVQSATLTLENPDPLSNVGSPIFEIDYDTDPVATVESTNASIGIFNDLSGDTPISAGQVVNSAGDVVITINPAALSLFNTPGFIVIGGFVTNTVDGNNHYLFGTLGADGLNGEFLTFNDVPEPASFFLIGSGLAALGLFARRRVSRS